MAADLIELTSRPHIAVSGGSSDDLLADALQLLARTLEFLLG
jgi:hypothetical protein